MLSLLLIIKKLKTMKQTIKTKILVTGSNGRFATVMKKKFIKKNYIFLDKKKLNILSKKVLEKFNKI